MLTTGIITQAQVSISYDLCPELQQLEGEYLYHNGSTEIKIYLRYKRQVSYAANTGETQDCIFDNLIGWVEYKENGIVVESTYSNRFMNLPYSFFDFPIDSYSILLSYEKNAGCNSNKLSGFIRDYGHSKERKIVDATLSNNNQTILWKQDHSEFYGVSTGDTGMTLPREFVLIKQ